MIYPGNAAARDHLPGRPKPTRITSCCAAIVDAAGKSRAQINGRPASVAEVRELGATLLERNAQHEHQALLRNAMQRELLDRYADAASELREWCRRRGATLATRGRRWSMKSAADAIARERDAPGNRSSGPAAGQAKCR